MDAKQEPDPGNWNTIEALLRLRRDLQAGAAIMTAFFIVFFWKASLPGLGIFV